MATVSQTIPNYYGGLSEQPDELKIPGQVNKLINTLPDITQGLLKRPGGRLIGGNMGSVTSDSKWFHYYRDENEQYMGQLKLSDGTLKMWALTKVVDPNGATIHEAGAAVNVVYNSADATAIKNYLKQTSNADAGNVQTLTLNDNTYITNRTVTTAMKATVSPIRPPEAYIELKKVAYASQYSVNLFDTTATTAVSTATRIEIDRDRDSSNTCGDTDKLFPSSGTEPGSSGYTARCNKGGTDPDHDDDVMPNVGTKIFAIDSGTPGNAADANNWSWSSTVKDSGNNTVTDRENLFFRITTTGQPVAQGNDADPEYYSRYTTTHDLLYGGEGWEVGDYFYVWLKNARYKITIKQTSVANIQCNLGKIRPEPTSFDTKTAVTAESILGAIRTEILGDSNGGVNELYEWKHDTGNDYHVQQIGNGLYISRPTAQGTFNLNTPVNDLLNVFTNSVKDVADLPSQCKHGYVVRIANSVADEDDYYVKFIGKQKADGTYLDGDGVWEECPEPGRKISLDPATMPVNLVRLSTGNFYLAQLDGYTNNALPGKDITPMPISTLTQSTGVVTINDHGFTDNQEVYYFDGGSIGIKLNMNGSAPENDVDDGEKLYIDLIDANSFKLTDTSNGTGYTKFQNAGNNAQYLSTAKTSHTVDSWEDCLVGSTVTVPEPSFIGKGINKMLFFRNRMVMLSDENVIMSRPGDFFNYWPKTAVTYTATDNVDISCSSEYPAIVYDGIQVNTGLLLFTKNQQFMLTTDSDVLSPNTAKINALCTYNFNFKTNPISMGTTVAFLDNAGKFSRFFEISAVLREGQPEVLEQSKAVSRSFPKDVDIVANSRENSIVFFAKTGDSKVYGYRYFSGIEKRLQQAWFQWELSGAIQNMAMMDDALFVVIRNRDTDVLQKFNIKIDDESNTWVDDQGTLTDDSDDLTHRVHLDNAVVIPSSDLTVHATSGTHSYASFLCPAGFNKTNLEGTYVKTSDDIITVTFNGHEFKVGQKVNLEFTSGSWVSDGVYTVLSADTNTFTVENPWSAAEGTNNVTIDAVYAVMVVAAGDDKTLQGTYASSSNDMYSYTSSGTTRIRLPVRPNTSNWKTYESGGSTITPTNNIIFGYLYDMEVKFPTIYKQDRVGETSYKADIHSSLILHRVKLSLGPSSVFDIIAKKNNKDTYTESFTGLDPDEVVTDRPVTLPDQKVTIPLYEKNINLELSMKSTHASPATLYSLTWEGDHTDAYYKRV